MTTSTQATVIDEYDLVIHVPLKFKGVRLEDASVPGVELPENVTPGNFLGREMIEAELNRYPVVHGFVAKGWRFEKVPPGFRVGVVLRPPLAPRATMMS
jgi:hypothetical protein